MAGIFTGENAINGAFGTIIYRGAKIANIQNIEARVAAERRAVRIAGSIAAHYKRVGVTGEGTFTVMRVTSEFMDIAADLFDPLKRVVPSDMTILINDPDTGTEVEEITLENVKLWEIPLGFNVEDLISQVITFTFEGMVVEREITQPVPPAVPA